jgi:hypothetical protein
MVIIIIKIKLEYNSNCINISALMHSSNYYRIKTYAYWLKVIIYYKKKSEKMDRKINSAFY